MYATGLILFRETLEAALFVGIVAAATRGLAGRGRKLTGGVIAGAVASLLLAAGMGRISAWADGIGQDLLNVIILSAALLMLTWHCVWVSPQAKEMAQEAQRIGSAALEGTSTLWALSTAVALAVLREGAESVLFVAGFMSGANEGQLSMLTGAAAGLAGGAAAGALIYWGLARIRPQHLFSVTNVLIMILAGSLASQLAKTLSQAGLVVRFSEPVWDASALLSNNSSVGTLLHALVGYDASPSGLQLAFYVGTIGLIWLAANTRKIAARRKQGAAVTI